MNHINKRFRSSTRVVSLNKNTYTYDSFPPFKFVSWTLSTITLHFRARNNLYLQDKKKCEWISSHSILFTIYFLLLLSNKNTRRWTKYKKKKILNVIYHSQKLAEEYSPFCAFYTISRTHYILFGKLLSIRHSQFFTNWTVLFRAVQV